VLDQLPPWNPGAAPIGWWSFSGKRYVGFDDLVRLQTIRGHLAQRDESLELTTLRAALYS